MATTRLLVTWADEFNLGMPEIDEQHKVLIDLVNQVWTAVVDRSGTENAIGIVGELEKYTITHFAEEEVFMRVMAYSQFATHKEAHEVFVARVALEKAKILAGQPVALEMVHFLKDWLINHILVSDKDYAREFTQRAKPPSAVGRFFKRFFG